MPSHHLACLWIKDSRDCFLADDIRLTAIMPTIVRTNHWMDFVHNDLDNNYYSVEPNQLIGETGAGAETGER